MTTPSADWWYQIWSHRDDLLKIARRRSLSEEDAEDAVHEAMLRASQRPWLDPDRLGAWLTTVTVRLCMDRHREVARDADARAQPVHTVPVPVEEAVCDRAEARWLANRSRELPPRQAEALRLKAEELDVGQVAREMGLNYRTVESLLARARRTLRRSLAGTLALLGWLLGRPRPGGGPAAQAAVATSSAATLAVLGFAVPASLPELPDPRPPVTSQAEGEEPGHPGGDGGTAGRHPVGAEAGAEDGAAGDGPAEARERPEKDRFIGPAERPDAADDPGPEAARMRGPRGPRLPDRPSPGVPELPAAARAAGGPDVAGAPGPGGGAPEPDRATEGVAGGATDGVGDRGPDGVADRDPVEIDGPDGPAETDGGGTGTGRDGTGRDGGTGRRSGTGDPSGSGDGGGADAGTDGLPDGVGDTAGLP